ncbi:hypothetical protein BY458DRAFT_515470 [Sporodiniella umbellata]|nr:hypothetical protein BY458DRAFT_515470 [Sporodiniella umbellata]
MPTPPPFLNFRAGVAIGSCFYLPFMGSTPYCYIFDLKAGEWSYRKLNTDGTQEFHAQVTSASAVGQKIYLVGGRLLKSYTLSNSLLEIDTETFQVRLINDAQGTPPRPRHEHSVDTIGHRYLVVFGGLCYNSVGENDVFVYDTLKNTWCVPHISGQFPHLRFGHASAVVGKDLYIHAGAQIDSDSSYIIYDDLYKLDCQQWIWYKYEHPEAERYLRSQPQRETAPRQRDYWIQTTGDNPHDRFQAYMCAMGSKLVILGGHSIRMDQDDNEILCNYPLDELSVFNTRRQLWSTLRAQVLRKEDEDYMTVSNMCAAVLPMDPQGFKVYIFAGKKYYDANKKRPSVVHLHGRSSSSGSSNSLVDSCCDVYAQNGSLQSIMEHDSAENKTEDTIDPRHCTEHHTTIHQVNFLSLSLSFIDLFTLKKKRQKKASFEYLTIQSILNRSKMPFVFQTQTFKKKPTLVNLTATANKNP